MKFLITAIICLTLVRPAFSQQFNTRNGFVGFYSKTAVEDIKAENNQVLAAIDPTKKQIAFALLNKGFVFPKQLMQDHFNENYIESDKYPKATFAGSYTGDVDPTKDGVYKVVVKGNLSIHNVTKPVETPGTIEVKGGHLIGTAEFKVTPEDFNVSIPSLVRDKIDKQLTVKVRVDCAGK
jgi:polyisoprenoid-binding protein YceI